MRILSTAIVATMLTFAVGSGHVATAAADRAVASGGPGFMQIADGHKKAEKESKKAERAERKALKKAEQEERKAEHKMRKAEKKEERDARKARHREKVEEKKAWAKQRGKERGKGMGPGKDK